MSLPPNAPCHFRDIFRSSPKGDGCEMDICGFGNGEAQWYRKENVVIRDGKLSITAKAESYAGNIYTSAKVI